MTQSFPPRWRAWLLCALLLLGGCASNGNPRDPLEPLNRGIYRFNEHADNLLLKPAAELYGGRVIPQFVRTGVSNFFSNINDVIVALNSLLQGKVQQAALDVSRIVVNTTIGLLGVLDVATDMGLEKHNEDFGQTLGYWGFGSGPYLVLPFLGPSSFRDGIGLIGDIYSDPRTYIDSVRTRNQVFLAGFINRRYELLGAGDLLKVAALDPYEFLRDAYLQRRHNLVHDGNPPEEGDVEPKDSPSMGKDKPAAAPVRSEETFVWKRETDPEARAAALVTGVDKQPEPAAQPAPARSETRIVRVWLSNSRN